MTDAELWQALAARLAPYLGQTTTPPVQPPVPPVVSPPVQPPPSVPVGPPPIVTPSLNFAEGQAGASTFVWVVHQGGTSNLALRDQIVRDYFAGNQNAFYYWYNGQSYGAGGRLLQGR